MPGGNQLRVTVTDAAAHVCTLDVPGDHPALASRKSASPSPASPSAAPVTAPAAGGVSPWLWGATAALVALVVGGLVFVGRRES